MKTWTGLVGIAVSFLWLLASPAAGGTVTVNGQSPGPTPFIGMLDLTVNNPNSLKSIQFEVALKPGSVGQR